MKTKKIGLSITAAFAYLISLTTAHSGEDFYDHHGMMGQWYGHMWGGSINGILMSIVLILIIVLLFILIQKQLQKR